MRVVAIILIFIGTIMFMNGYHSIDLAYNSENVSYDQTISGKILDIQDIYANGIYQLFIGLILNMIGCYYAGKIIKQK